MLNCLLMKPFLICLIQILIAYAIVISTFTTLTTSLPILSDTPQDLSPVSKLHIPQDANALPIPKADADKAFDAATCIGCGACVATCKNSSAMLFVSAKVSQFSLLPQGKVEKDRRVLNMVDQMDSEGFGNCTNTGACEVECPKGISLFNIARMNKDFLIASVLSDDK